MDNLNKQEWKHRPAPYRFALQLNDNMPTNDRKKLMKFLTNRIRYEPEPEKITESPLMRKTNFENFFSTSKKPNKAFL